MIETQCPVCRLWRGHHAPDCPAAPTPPTPPLPHAAADTSPVAGVVAPYRNASDYDDAGEWMERLVGPDGWECELGEPEDRTWGRDGSPVIAELNRLVAERDRLALSNAELSATLSRLDADWERTCAAVRQEYEAEVARLSAELAALRAALPDPRMLEDAAMALDGIVFKNRKAERLEIAARAVRAALATAPPTPPAAEAGMGGDRHKDALNALCSLGVAAGDDATFRRATAAGLSAWAVGRDARAAIDAALDQEDDHAQ